jgi:hypothetical protein
MHRHTQQQHSSKQGRLRKVATAVVLAGALAGPMLAGAGGPGAPAGMPAITLAAEPASVMLTMDGAADAALATSHDLLEGATTAQVCYYEYFCTPFRCFYRWICG